MSFLHAVLKGRAFIVRFPAFGKPTIRSLISFTSSLTAYRPNNLIHKLTDKIVCNLTEASTELIAGL